MDEAMKKNVVKREELYEQVWKTPLCRLAAQYGISDVGLAKICKKLKIPKPSRGYWAKLEFGKKVKPTALPKLAAGESAKYTLNQWDKRENSVSVDPEIEQRISAKIKIVVSERLSKPHRLVRDARALLKNAYPDKYGMISVFREPCLDVRISCGSLGRALRVLDALIKGLEAQGFKANTEAGCVFWLIRPPILV